MACCETRCNECEWEGVNVFLNKCPVCGTGNVDRDYDPDEMYANEEEE